MGRILGLDPGSVRCGVAVSDSGRTMAFPRPALRSGPDLVTTIARMVDEESVDLVVIGRPVSLAGRETASTLAANQLAYELRAALAHATVLQWDERLTTAQATRQLRAAGRRAEEHRERVDSAAATVLLEHYLEALRAR